MSVNEPEPTRARIAEALLDSAADAVVYADAKGRIGLWNPGAERIFGYTPAEALGQSLDIIIPESLRARHWAGYETFMATGQSRYGAGDLLRVPGVRKDGTRISLEFTIAAVRRPDGAIAGIVAVLRDVSAQFEELRALRKRAAGGA